MKIKRFIFYRSSSSGHGAFMRQEILINYLNANKLNTVIFTEDNKTYSSFYRSKILLLKNIKQIKFNKLYRWLFLAKASYEFLRKNLSCNSVDTFIAFSEYEVISYKISIVFAKLFFGFKALFFNNKKLDNVHIIFMSRGDIVKIFLINNPHKSFIDYFRRPFLSIYYRLLQMISLSICTKCSVQLTFLKELMIGNLGKFYKDKILIIPNNIIKNDEKQKEKSIITKNKSLFTIGFASPFYDPLKGLDIFIDIIDYLDHIGFLFNVKAAGKGPYKEWFIEKLSNTLDSKRFKYFGWLNKISLFLDDIDLLIIPSRYDSCPNLLLESLGHKNVKILCSDIRAHREILLREELLFDINSVKDAHFKIEYLSKISNNKYKTLIQKSYDKYSFNWEEKILKSLLS